MRHGTSAGITGCLRQTKPRSHQAAKRAALPRFEVSSEALLDDGRSQIGPAALDK